MSSLDPTSAGNVTGTERWLSLAAGVALTLAAMRRGNPLRKLVLGAAGASLINRGATGYCAVKAAVGPDATPLRDGLREQWSRTLRGVDRLGPSGLRERLGTRLGILTRPFASPSRAIDNMHVLYVVELQELHSAERQMIELVERLAPLTAHAALAERFRTYAGELRARCSEIDTVLTGIGAATRAHPDQAMRALLDEARKVSQIAVANLRDAALLASLQRIVHYKIAGYGTIAAYAKALGRADEAARFARFADQDKAMDAELSELARETLHPDASRAPGPTTAEIRTH